MRSGHSNGPRTSVTPAEAKAVYESMERPSLRGTALLLKASGRKVHISTLQHWKKNGWTRQKDRRTDMTNVAPVLTGSPFTKISDLVPPSEAPATGPLGEADGRRAALEAMSDDALATESNRHVHITAVLLSQEIQRQCSRLVGEFPQQVGALLQAIATSVECANVGYQKLREDQMKTVQQPALSNGHAVNGHGPMIDDDPLVIELKAWETAQ